jgi:2-polyprenyl-6-methoxyphenol hydroxylase-like FAD-dependent oxidoreductase
VSSAGRPQRRSIGCRHGGNTVIVMGNDRTGRAIVVGASMAGLCTARALHETFGEVIVLDRDALPDGPAPRRGVPQGRHAHGILARGLAALDELFDGLSIELIQRGALPGDVQLDMHWWLDGRLLAPARSGLGGLAVSRPLLEDVIRRRVAALPGVMIVADCEAVDLLPSAEGSRVAGVGTARAGSLAVVGDADLVVDAGGRASRSPIWLRSLGYPAAAEEGIDVRLTYVSRLFHRTGRELNGRLGTAIAAYPGSPRAGLVLAQEGDRFIASISGWFGEVPPTDGAGMTAWAQGLAAGDIAEIFGGARPLGDPVPMRFPPAVRRRYELLDDFPGGYLVTGDAVCSFNPIYGQGMTVLALEALLLRDLLAEGRDDLPRRFFAGVAELIEAPWSLANRNDLRFPQSGGGAAETDYDRYLARLRHRLADDPVLATAFLRVTNLVDAPESLLAPEIMARVAGSVPA